MRKWFLAALLLVATTGVFAQADTWYFSVMPGYQFSSGEVDGGYVFSLDGGYYFTDNVALHAGFIFNEGNFSVDVYPYGEASFDDQFNMLVVGPEFATKAGANGQVYFQVDLGYAFGLNMDDIHVVGMTVPLTGVSVDDAFCYGAAIGYRHFFNEKVALNLQGTYHRVTGDWDTNHLDARIGVAWRF